MIYAENILLCIAVPLLISLLFVRGEVRRYVAAFLLGMGVCLIAAYISGFLNLVTGMGENDTSVFLSPVVEELMKLMPLLFFLVMLRRRTGRCPCWPWPSAQASPPLRTAAIS